MNYSAKHKKQSIIFKQWTGKNYAIFASLGKEVKIGHVCNDVVEKAVLKSESVILNCINVFSCLDEAADEDIENDILKSEQLVSLLSVINSSDLSSGRLPISQNQIINKEFLCCKNSVLLCALVQSDTLLY